MAWYLALPKYTKELQQKPTGERLERKNQGISQGCKLRAKQQQAAFVKMPEACQLTINDAGVLIDVNKKYQDRIG